MTSFCDGLWPWPPAPGQGGDSVDALPLISIWTAWIDCEFCCCELCCCPVRVQTSCAAISWRMVEPALAAAPPRFTVAVVPVTATCIILVPSGNSVTAGGEVPFCSHCGCGSLSSAPTRLVTSCVGEVPVGTNTASGTST